MRLLSNTFFIWILLVFVVNVEARESGWTIIKPAKDSRIIYVSSSSGQDALGKVYSSTEINDLENPGNIRAFKSLKLARSKMRKGYPDILLFKRGDEWTIDKSMWPQGGRSADEKMVFMAYGSDSRRPKINSSNIVFRIWGDAHNVAIIGLYLYAYQRDPDSDHFAGWDSIGNPSGIHIYGERGTMRSYLIEDTRINYFDGAITVTGNAKHEDIVIRRNIIQNSYDTRSHSQGIYAKNASILLEENVFDHNGWYQQRLPEGGGASKGQATMYNHNTYFVNSYNTVFRNNLFLRASSQNNKWAANPPGKSDSIVSQDLLIENNFYYGGEIGIGLGGNRDFNTGFRWQNIDIRDNVLLAIGKNQPTRRNIAWYIGISDWSGGSVCGNYLLHNENDGITNLRGINVNGHVSDVLIGKNTIAGLRLDKSNKAAITFNNHPKQNIKVTENRIQFPESRMKMINAGRSFDGVIAKNVYFGKAAANEWFMHNDKVLDIEEWRKLTGDETSIVSEIEFLDSSRNLATYLKTIGISGHEEFFSKLAKRSRFNWDERLSAQSINAYIREGYGDLSCESR